MRPVVAVQGAVADGGAWGQHQLEAVSVEHVLLDLVVGVTLVRVARRKVVKVRVLEQHLLPTIFTVNFPSLKVKLSKTK